MESSPLHRYAVAGHACVVVGVELVNISVELIVLAQSQRAATMQSRRVAETLIGTRRGSVVSHTMRAVPLLDEAALM